jgi:hypothetical protein
LNFDLKDRKRNSSCLELKIGYLFPFVEVALPLPFPEGFPVVDGAFLSPDDFLDVLIQFFIFVIFKI